MKNKTSKNGKIEVDFEEITPAIAKKYLARNVTNRNLKDATIRSYESDMRAGSWLPTHQGIAFNDRDELIDGQHRLTAIVRAGVTVTMLVTRGLPGAIPGKKTTTMDAVDRGVPRSIGDQLKLQHGFSNPNLAVATVVMIGNLALATRVRKQTVAQALKAMELYGRHCAEIGKVIENPKERRFRRAPLSAAFTFARVVEPHAVDRFLNGLLTGASLEAGSPVLTLRNFLLSEVGSSRRVQGSLSRRVALADMILNSLRAYVAGEKMTRIHETREGFVFFASRQKENLQKLAEIYLLEPASLEFEPLAKSGRGLSALIPDAGPQVKSTVAKIVRSASDIVLTPLAEDLIRRQPRYAGGGGAQDALRLVSPNEKAA